MRPPKEFEGKPWHWVRPNIRPPEPMQWYGNAWIKVGDQFEYSTRFAEEHDWVWLGVAEPPAYGWGDRGA